MSGFETNTSKGLEKPTPSSNSQTGLPRQSTLGVIKLTNPNLTPSQKWMEVEDIPELAQFKEKGQNNYEKLFSDVVRELKNDSRPIARKIRAIYEIAKSEGYKIVTAGNKGEYGGSLRYSFAVKQLDCDTSSSFVASIAQNLGWDNLKVVSMPGHVFIRRNGVNFDYGESPPDKHYASGYGVTDLKAREVDAAQGISANSYYVRGYLHYRAGRHREAIADCSKAVALNPLNSDAYSLRAASYTKTGELEKALQDHNTAIGITPSFRRYYEGRAYTLRLMGRYSEAIADLDAYLKPNPADANALLSRGYSYAALKNYDKALADYERAIAIAPKNTDNRYYRGELHLAHGNFKKALADFTRVVSLEPHNSRGYYKRAEAYSALGKEDFARRDLDMAKQIDSAPSGPTQSDKNLFSFFD